MVIIITIKTGATDEKDKIKESRLRWYGHVRRSGDDSFLKNIRPYGRRGQRKKKSRKTEEKMDRSGAAGQENSWNYRFGREKNIIMQKVHPCPTRRASDLTA